MRLNHEGVRSIQILGALFKQFVRHYGPRISNVTLRNAISAYVGAYSLREFVTYADQVEYACHAYEALKKQVGSPHLVNERALFASDVTKRHTLGLSA
jgi:hypothetical protein